LLVKLGLRIILSLVAVSALVLIGLTYVGDAISMNGLAAVSPGSRGSGFSIPEERLAYLKDNFLTMYKLWGYARVSGIVVVILAILGFIKSGRAQ